MGGNEQECDRLQALMGDRIIRLVGGGFVLRSLPEPMLADILDAFDVV